MDTNSKNMVDVTQRFSSRVENYVKYRPTYPKEVLGFLQKNCRLTSASMVADIGSGTGILTELFLKNGNSVYAIEPNDEMRGAGERLLKDYSGFKSVAATAEKTTLKDGSVDLVVAGQAFHWFDREKTRTEFKRILKPEGWVVLIWNDRRVDDTPFSEAYEQLLKAYGTDYEQVDHRKVDENALNTFFGSKGFKKESFANFQTFDFTGLKGRLLSCSYVPEAGHSNYDPMLAELKKIFEKYQERDKVTFEYRTDVCWGQLT